jgi:hypothetical protein
MICWHRNYNLGDEHSYDSDDFLRQLAFEACEGLEEKVDRLENAVWDRLFSYTGSVDRTCFLIDAKVSEYVDSIVRDGYVILPLFLMDHSGISMGTGSFGCPWDSGQVGWIVCDNETIQRDFNGDRDLAEKALESEVKVYDDYLTGNVYGFIVEERDKSDCPTCKRSHEWDETDSCWGFFGDDIHTNGITDHLDADLIGLAENAEVEFSH